MNTLYTRGYWGNAGIGVDTRGYWPSAVERVEFVDAICGVIDSVQSTCGSIDQGQCLEGQIK